MKIRNVSVIVFYDDQNRILIQDRSNIGKATSKYGFFGGGMEEGETKEECVVRETKEELTYDLKEYKYIGTYEYILEDKNLKPVVNVFVSPLKNKLKEFKQEEGAGMKLANMDEAQTLMRSDHEGLRMVKKYLENENLTR